MLKNAVKSLSKRASTLLFFVAFLFVSCKNSPATDSKESSFSSDIPFDSSLILIDPVPDSSTEQEATPPPLETDPDVWDTADTDISYIDPDRKLISFTFDDSPSKTLENIFAVFASFNEDHPECKATATVFFNGYLFNSTTPHLLQTACALGFELGNHTHSHYDLTTLSAESLQKEIDKTDALLEKADHHPRHLVRAPYGKTDDFVNERVPAPLISWSIDTLDWKKRTEDEIYETVYSNRFSGAIVLMHDGQKNTVNALKRLLPDLAADGYQIVSVSALAKAHGVVLRNGNEYIRARKQAK